MNMWEKESVMSTPSEASTAAIQANRNLSSCLSANNEQRNSPRFHSRVTQFDRWLTKKMVEVVGNPPVRISLWDGVEVTPPVDNPVAILVYCNRSALLKTIADPELHWGNLYCNGEVKFEGDMVEFMETIYRGITQTGKGSLLQQFVLWLGHRRISNSHDKARDNIHSHYDIGNDFYKLWLDTEAMQYTCAYFHDPDINLEQAQIAKMHHICRKLQLKPGDTVVESGSGWGGLSRFMAANYSVTVKAYNISKEQVKYSQAKAQEENLSDHVEYILDDYRNITGKFDAFVSVGMLEHVGKRDLKVMGEVIERCLKPDGRGLMHTIGRNKTGPMNAWIERRIFPGAYPPTLREMMDIFEPNQLSVLDVENMRMHYSKTLQHWMERFEQNKEQIEEQMDGEFVKAWRLYLAGSTAAFNVGDLQLFQVVFSRVENNDLPWSRTHIYSDKAKLSVIHPENSHAEG